MSSQHPYLRSALIVVPEDPKYEKASFDLIALSEAPWDDSFFSAAVMVKEVGQMSGEEKCRRVIQVVKVDGASDENSPRGLVDYVGMHFDVVVMESVGSAKEGNGVG